jgi:predicted Zn-dependent protease
LCKEALTTGGEAEAEIFARSKSRGVARFAISELGQHMELVEPTAYVRVARGLKIGESTTTDLTHTGLVRAVHDAARIAEAAPETKDFPGFAGSAEDGPRVPRDAASTRNATAEKRVELLRPAMDAIASRKLVSAGVLETETLGAAVATTRGCARQHDESSASYRVWALETAGAGGAAGFGSDLQRDIDRLRIREETERAIRFAELGREPISVDVGRYDVVFEPAAIAELLESLAMIAFPAPELEKGSSPLAGRFGEPITSADITITEDANDPSELGFGAPFDREGTWRARTALIERGIARGALYDRTTANRHGAKSTGSAAVGDLLGPIGAASLHMAGGDYASSEALIAGVKRGLYVCRLHYVNAFLEPRRAVMTGLTRDGCFLIEDGKIARPVGNVRFTDSFLEALARSDGMTRDRAAIRSWISETGATVVPAVRIRELAITGRSQERVPLGAG